MGKKDAQGIGGDGRGVRVRERCVRRSILGAGWGGSGLVSGSGKSVCLGNVFDKGFQGFGFGFGEEVADVQVGVAYFVV